MENKEELNQAKESELESANGGLDLFGALFSLKKYQEFIEKKHTEIINQIY